MTTWSQTNSVCFGVHTTNGEIGRDTDSQWHWLLRDSVVLWEVLERLRDVVNGGLVSNTANDTVLVR